MIIDGKQLAQTLRENIKQRVQALAFKPVLCDVIVGSDPVSLSFVRIKQRTAEEVGLAFKLVQLPETATTQEVIAEIKDIQAEPNLCGLIVQLPLPENVDAESILSAIDAKVDVDQLNPQNTESNIVPPTAGAILYILDSLNINLAKEKILVVGQGNLVGKPITQLLKKRGLEVSTADAKSTDTAELLQAATVVITGIGKPKSITGDMVSDGVIIVDAGTSESGGSISGDVDFDSALPKARFITPVPGGVGPITVAKLLDNVITVAEGNTARQQANS